MTRHQKLMERLMAFYKPDRPFNKERLAAIINIAAAVIIEEMRSSPDEIMQMMAGSMLSYVINPGPEAAEQALEYARYFYNEIFVGMHRGDRAVFKSHLAEFSGSCFEALILMGEAVSRPGRRVTRQGKYEIISIEVREDLLVKMDDLSQSRRAIIEDLLEEKFKRKGSYDVFGRLELDDPFIHAMIEDSRDEKGLVIFRKDYAHEQSDYQRRIQQPVVNVRLEEAMIQTNHQHDNVVSCQITGWTKDPYGSTVQVGFSPSSCAWYPVFPSVVRIQQELDADPE